MLNVRLAGGHLYGKQLFTWLSLVVSLMASFCAVLFLLDVLDEIWDVTESVSEGFPTYSSLSLRLRLFGSRFIIRKQKYNNTHEVLFRNLVRKRRLC